MVEHQSFQMNAESFHFWRRTFVFFFRKGKRSLEELKGQYGLQSSIIAQLKKSFLVQILFRLTSKIPDTETSHYGLRETCHVVKALDVACKEEVVQRSAGTLNQ